MKREMTALRHVPLPIHSALEMLIGLALIGAPFALGLTAPALIVGVVVGAILAGVALQAVDPGRTTSVSAHHAADHGVALGLAGAAFVLATVDGTAAVLFGAAAAAQLALNLTTRYSAR
jgi:uncharacterized cupin superfamily protein